MPNRRTETPSKKSTKKRSAKQKRRSSQNSSSSSSSSSSSDDGPTFTPDEISELSLLIDSVEQGEEWETIAEYVDEISPQLLTQSLRYRNDTDSTPLHGACRFDPPLNLLREFIRASPEMALWSDSFGWLPLHYACANGASEQVVKLLLDAYPGGGVEVDKRGRTPLHFALCNADHPVSEPMARMLVKPFENTSAASIGDENDMLPVHYACAYGSTEDVLQRIIEGYDEGIKKVDFKGRTPLHFVMGSSDRDNSVEIMKIIIKDILLVENHQDEWDDNAQNKSEHMVNIMDHEKNLPLHLLSKKAFEITKQEKDLMSAPTMTDDGVQDFSLFEKAQWLVMAKERIRKCLQLYLSAEPETTSKFLKGTQHLPDWIRDEAVLHPTIQHMLNDRISRRFPTMILLLDVYLNIAIIICFTLVSLDSAKLRGDSSNLTSESRAVTSPLVFISYIGCVYFLMREISQAISVKLQRGMFAYFRDPENLINLSFIFMTITFTMVINYGWGSSVFFHDGAAITIGFCYLQLLAYLRTISIDFAVFLSGISHIVGHLGAFMSILAITLMAFSQMWYTAFKSSSICLGDGNSTDITELMKDDLIFQYYDDAFFMPEPEEIEDCEPQIELPYCEGLGWSIYKTYTMLFGLGDGLLEFSTMSMILSIVWLFIVVLIILNLLVGVICDLYADATTEQAAIVFWTKRLAFVTDMDWVCGPLRKNLCRCCNKNHDKETEMDFILKSTAEETQYPSRKRWGRFIRSFDPSRDNSFTTYLLRFVVWFCIVPAWLILGIFTAGFFWPPQLREGLFKQKIYHKEESPDEERFESLKLTGKDLTNAKNEIVHQFVVDRKGMKRVRERTKTARKEIKDEIRNMKGVMTSLYEIQQQILS